MGRGVLFFESLMLDPNSFFDGLETMQGPAFVQFVRDLLLLATTSTEPQQWQPFGA